MRRLLPLIILMFVSYFSIPAGGFAQPYYVALNGSDTNNGTLSSPFLTIEKAVSVVQSGQIIYIRGGSDDKTLKHNFTLKNCLAFNNKAKGFDQNSNMGSMILYNCTGYGNLVANYRIKTELAAGKVLVVKNCAELGGTAEIGAFADQAANSWLSPFVVTAGDFRSTDPVGADGPRKAEGSLPHIEYMHLAPGSDLIDAGVNVGLPFMGTAPDLGYFETGLTVISDTRISTMVVCYPNPVCVIRIIKTS